MNEGLLREIFHKSGFDFLFHDLREHTNNLNITEEQFLDGDYFCVEVLELDYTDIPNYGLVITGCNTIDSLCYCDYQMLLASNDIRTELFDKYINK